MAASGQHRPAGCWRFARDLVGRKPPKSIEIVIVLRREDPEPVLDAMAYVGAVHIDSTAENTAPALGVEGRVVAAILADPAPSDYMRTWALEASVASLPRSPIDATYERVCELLRRAGGVSTGLIRDGHAVRVPRRWRESAACT